MRRYTNWGLIFFMGLMAVCFSSSGYWLPEVQPRIIENAEIEDFSCPSFLDSEQCTNLQRLHDTDPKLAENLRDSLDPDDFLDVLNEPSLEDLANDLNENTADDPIITKVKTGQFQDLDIIRKAEGVVTIYEILSGEVRGRYLIFEDPFKVNKAPDLEVYLSIEQNPRNPEEFLANQPYKVALLKGNIGTQNFAIDLTLDLTDYRSVVIFSKEYNVILAVAPIFTN